MAVELDSNNNGAIDIEKGGTNATTAADARVNLGLAIGVDVAPQGDARFPTAEEKATFDNIPTAAEKAGAWSLKDYSETRVNLGTLGATYTIDLANGNYLEGTVGANNVTVTLPAAPASGLTKSFTVAIKQHASAAKTVTFSGGAGIKYLSSTTAASTSTGKWTVWTFFYSETEAKWMSTGAIQEP
jgi:hypothetical protein